MNILFFLDPSVDFNNPLFRFITYRNTILPQAKAFLQCGHSVSLIANDVIIERAKVLGFYLDEIDYIPIDTLEVKRIEPLSSASLSKNEKALERYLNLIANAWKERKSPDFIIVWESIGTILNQKFPLATILYEIPGFFSRAPYPFYIHINKGILSNNEKAKKLVVPKHNLDEFSKQREGIQSILSACCEFKNKLDKWKASYQKLILFPLQVDGYFMIDSQIKGSQLDILINVLETIPSDYGLIVTDYRSKDISSNVIGPEINSLLRNKYSNYIYDAEINNAYCSSQQILPYIDAVITISSSVGLQCAFWQKPLLVLGKNHISPFSTAESIEDLIDQAGKSFDQDTKIIATLATQNIPAPSEKYGYVEWVNDFLELVEEAKNRGKSSLFSEKKIDHTIDWFSKNLRINEYTKATKYSQKKDIIDRENCIELINQIKKHKIISFDIFDTLLVRPFISPTDAFNFMEIKIRDYLNDPWFNFTEVRKISEKNAFEKILADGKGEITIDNIYEEFQVQTNLDIETVTIIKKIEEETEYKTLYIRQSIYNGYLKAISLGKKIIITSDMYLPKDVIESILQKNHITFDKLYLSSDIGVKKNTGKLFEYIIKDLGCNPNEILHVGDNVKGDLIIPKGIGIHCFHMPRTINRMLEDPHGFYKKIWKRDERNHNLSARSLISILGNYVYDNSYLTCRKNTLFNANAENLGYTGFGPLLLGYVKWLCEQSIKDKIHDLFFLARDGKIMKEAYDIISKNYVNAPKSHYMLCSRRSVNLCKIKDYHGINDLIHVEFASGITLGFLLENRFGINPAIISEEYYKKHNLSPQTMITNSDSNSLSEFLFDIKELILKEANEERENYIQYLLNLGFIDSQNAGIVDIGYAGTMQQSLYEITKIKTTGYYLITFRKALERLDRNGLESKGYLGNFIDRHDTCQPFCRYVPLFETLFSSTETSFIKIVKINNRDIKVFAPENAKEDKRRSFVRAVHKGALKFIEQISSIFTYDLEKIDIEPFKAQRALIDLFNNPDPREAKLFAGIIFEDSYGGKSEKIILPEDIEFKGNVVWTNGLQSLKCTKKEVLTPDTPEKSYIELHSELRTPKTYMSGLIYRFYKSKLDTRKLTKLETKPEQFFEDSKNFFAKKILSRLYMAGLN